MDFLTVADFPFLCGFCLLQSNDLEFISEIPSVSLFQTITGTQKYKLPSSANEAQPTYDSSHAPEVSKNSGKSKKRMIEKYLPEKICFTCIQKFKEFSAFVEKSKENINYLKSIIKNSINQSLDTTGHEDLNSFLGNDKHACNKRGTIKTSKQETICTESKSKKYFNNIKTSNRQYNDRNGVLNKNPNGETVNRRSIRKLQQSCSKSKNCKVKPSTFECSCGVFFINKNQLDSHYKKNPNCQPKDHRCALCDKAFNRKHRLITHMRSHTKEAPFGCPQCEKKFRFKQNLRRHTLIHEGIKAFKCDVCGKEFSRAHVKNEHMNIHTGENPYICMYCGKGFKRYANHFIHVYRHKLINGEVDTSEETKSYLQLKCTICSKIFASRGSLVNHLPLHEEEPRNKKFLCFKCGKGFITKAQLESHTRTHTGDRPYQCSLCDKRFKQQSAYSNHQLVHSGKRPYKCKLCEKLFTQSGHLKVHMRVHSGEKPYKCSYCGKQFALKSNLTVHVRTHTGETPYICSVCGHGFCESTRLKKHMKTHGVDFSSQRHVQDGKQVKDETNQESDNIQ